jgi:hypothetical protein
MKRLFIAALASLGACTVYTAPPPQPGYGSGYGYADVRFAPRQEEAVRGYYYEEYRHGRCPPGLAKKHNGCMPPGQAKQWRRGQPLPRYVEVHELPPNLVVQVGPPPQGYRYVRVANDVLMIAAGTGIVVDAIEDLGRR